MSYCCPGRPGEKEGGIKSAMTSLYQIQNYTCRSTHYYRSLGNVYTYRDQRQDSSGTAVLGLPSESQQLQCTHHITLHYITE